MTTYAQRVVQESLVKVLQDYLPNVSFDLERVAAAIVERADIDAVEVIEAREVGMHEALTATMAYMNGCLKAQRARIDTLEAEVTRLTMELAKRPTP